VAAHRLGDARADLAPGWQVSPAGSVMAPPFGGLSGRQARAERRAAGPPLDRVPVGTYIRSYVDRSRAAPKVVAASAGLTAFGRARMHEATDRERAGRGPGKAGIGGLRLADRGSCVVATASRLACPAREGREVDQITLDQGCGVCTV
jgi:hypothetical protein